VLAFMTALGAAAVSGLAVLAFKYPAIYKRMFTPLYVLTFCVFAFVSAYSIGVSVAYGEAVHFIDGMDKSIQLRKALDAVSVPWLYPIVGLFAANGYLFLLDWLCNQIERHNAEKPSTSTAAD
jgi:hypothetical protein